MNNFIKEFRKYWKQKKYGQCIGVALLITTFVVAIIVLICLLLDMLIAFIITSGNILKRKSVPEKNSLNLQGNFKRKRMPIP